MRINISTTEIIVIGQPYQSLAEILAVFGEP